VADATAEATGESGIAIGTSRPAPTRRRAAAPQERAEEATPARRPEAVNDPIPFITFIAAYPLGAPVEGLVEGFTSHGAVVVVGDVRCYVPLSGLANPAPRSAREVLTRGERRTFVITALDPARRGVELAVPEVGVVRGVPSEETVAAEVAMIRPRAKRQKSEAAPPAKKAAAAKKVAPAKRVATRSEASSNAKTPVALPKKAPAAKKAVAKKLTSASVATPPAKAAVKRAAPQKAPVKRVAAKRAPAKKAAPAKRAAAGRVDAVAVEDDEGPRRSPRSRA
jgi:hypothetical protein